MRLYYIIIYRRAFWYTLGSATIVMYTAAKEGRKPPINCNLGGLHIRKSKCLTVPDTFSIEFKQG